MGHYGVDDRAGRTSPPRELDRPPRASKGMKCLVLACALAAVSCSGPAPKTRTLDGSSSSSVARNGTSPVSPTSPPATSRATATPGKAVVSISLDRTTVPARAPIKGLATVDNRTGAKIAIGGGTCDGWLFIGIANAELPYTPANGAVGCAPFEVPVGESRYPITISTTYQSCTQAATEATYTMPACRTGTSQVMPPLPPGIYHTVVAIPGPIEAANTVTVTLTSP